MLKITENGPRAVTIRRPNGLQSSGGRSLCSATSFVQLRGCQSCVFEPCAVGFDRFEFKFRPKRSDFGRKKLRTAETGFGFRLSEVIPYLGERGAALGGLQGAELENGFYPYSGWNSRNAPSSCRDECGCCHVPGYTTRQQVADVENRFFAFFDDD